MTFEEFNAKHPNLTVIYNRSIFSDGIEPGERKDMVSCDDVMNTQLDKQRVKDIIEKKIKDYNFKSGCPNEDYNLNLDKAESLTELLKELNLE